MEEQNSAEIWFFTRDGERLGPVSSHDLKLRALDGSLNPRLDMVWRQGMDQWLPAGEIDDLFDRVAPPPPPTLAELAPDDYDDYSSKKRVEDLGEWPGARRRGYIFATMIFPFLWFFAVGFGLSFLQGSLEPNLLAIVSFVATSIPLLVVIVFTIKRFTNLGMSGAWILAYLVPILNLWVGYRNFACPAGYAFHKKMDGIGWVLAILYWGSILLSLALVVITIFMIMQGAADGDFQTALEEFIRKIEEATEKAKEPNP